MDVLSTSAGSAQAIAAAAAEAVDSRAALERELDRLNAAIGAHAGAAAQHLQWTLLAQALLVTAYLVVLVGAWALPLPGKRWLLAAIATYALLSLVLGHLSHRGSRDRIGPLRQSRRLVEQALERIAARPIVFSRDGAIARSIGDWAAALMPVAVLAAWIGLAVYALAVPFPTDLRSADEARATPRAAASASAASPRAKGLPLRREEAAPAAVAESPPASEESGLAALFRRAMNVPSSESAEAIKP